MGQNLKGHRCSGGNGANQSIARRGAKTNPGRQQERVHLEGAGQVWACDNQVTLDFSRPGKPTDNPFIESFNGSFRDECLNVNWFLSLEDAKEKIGYLRKSIMASDHIVPYRV